MKLDLTHDQLEDLLRANVETQLDLSELMHKAKLNEDTGKIGLLIKMMNILGNIQQETLNLMREL